MLLNKCSYFRRYGPLVFFSYSRPTFYNMSSISKLDVKLCISWSNLLCVVACVTCRCWVSVGRSQVTATGIARWRLRNVRISHEWRWHGYVYAPVAVKAVMRLLGAPTAHHRLLYVRRRSFCPVAKRRFRSCLVHSSLVAFEDFTRAVDDSMVIVGTSTSVDHHAPVTAYC